MEKRIKIIYWLTIIALIALVAIQGYWLFNQYIYTLEQYENELFQKSIEAGQKDKEVRRALQDKRYELITPWKMSAKRNNSDAPIPQLEWILYTYVIDKNTVNIDNSILMQAIDSLSDNGRGVTKYTFNITNPHREYDIHEVHDRFHVNLLSPFQTERFDSLLQTEGIKALSIKTETTDSMIWTPQKISYTSIWNPTMEVTYPYNILQKEQVRITYRLGGSPILMRMFKSLFFSFILSLLLILCLIYQIKTIFKQQRIDDLRKNFLKTMIHELKRPVATLKMCISFMKNDKMMQDKTMKEDILRNSQNELDNLSSYFSKLRDLTYGDMEEIPLNLSTFQIQKLVNECIEKQNLPADRQIQITTHFDDDTTEITADRMHIINIICNLLENAIKYSESETSIRISGYSVRDKYRIEVSDNGFGISPAELPHVFDKFFRSQGVTGKNIPGIGLGLCYVKLLVIAHKGEIFVESTLGTGSKFTIEISKKQ
jgi:two-component system phosphate regulon sensor histidine kinase PhoR